MTDIAFDRTQTAMRTHDLRISGSLVQLFKSRLQPADFNRISQLGSRSMRLDITHTPWIYSRLRVRCF